MDGADEHDGGVLVATGAEEDDADNNPEQNVETPNNDNFSSQSSFLSSSSSNSGNRLISDFASFDENEYDCIKYMLTNSRSLSPKVLSLVAYFEELELGLALITESWLADGSRLDQDIAELEHGTDMSVLYKNRPLKPNSRRRTSGGVALVYNKIKCQFKEVRLKNNRFEMICARELLMDWTEKSLLLDLYMEPRMKVGTVEEIKSLLMDFILQEKAASNDPVFLIGGDMNKKDIVGAFDNYVDIIEVDHGPTRNGEKLDKTYTNFAADITTSKIYPPLQTELGLPSDHSCAVSRFLYKSRRRFTWTKIKLRKKTKEGNDMFGHLLEEEDWTKLYQGDTCPSSMVDKLHAKFGEWMNVCYPFKTLRRRSNEHPWITNYIRKKIRMKMRVFKREGRSRKWIDKEVKMLIRRSKQEYVGKAVQKCKDTGSNSTYYRVVKELNTKRI